MALLQMLQRQRCLQRDETNNNGVIQGSASYSVPNVPGTVYANYTGKIDVVSGAISITYNMSGGLTGTIVVSGTRTKASSWLYWIGDFYWS